MLTALPKTNKHTALLEKGKAYSFDENEQHTALPKEICVNILKKGKTHSIDKHKQFSLQEKYGSHSILHVLLPIPNVGAIFHRQFYSQRKTRAD